MNRNPISDREWIGSADISKFGSYTDRKTSFDDDKDIESFILFLKLVYNTTSSVEDYVFKPKPYGPYGVDLGIFKNNKLVLAIDIERWSKWNEEWPKNYKYVSFLSRKLKFVHKHNKFTMVFFNYDRSKFICVDGENITKYPSGARYTQGKMDSVIKIPFDDARLYGNNLTEKEKYLFKNHTIRKIK